MHMADLHQQNCASTTLDLVLSSEAHCLLSALLAEISTELPFRYKSCFIDSLSATLQLEQVFKSVFTSLILSCQLDLVRL